MPCRIIATCFALVCFAAAAAVGLAAGNPIDVVLWRAMVVMAAAWVVGRIIGWVLQSTVEDHIESYKRAHPIPGEDARLNHDGPAKEAA